MNVALKLPGRMTVAEFLGWDAPDGRMWQLVDGEPQAMAPASRTHGAVQGELGRLLGNHFADRGSPCAVVANPGLVPRVEADANFRIPDLAVTCTGYETEEYALRDPVLVVAILSPRNRHETWANIWAYTTMPSVREILVLETETITASLLRRDADGSWPAQPERIADGLLTLVSIGFSVPLAAVYRTTRLGRPA